MKQKKPLQFPEGVLRNPTNFTYEQTIAQDNYKAHSVDSFFLISNPEYSFISSTIVRDIARNGGNYLHMTP